MRRRVRGLKALIHDAVDFTADMVEEGHASIRRNALRVLDVSPELSGPAKLADGVYRASLAITLGSVRGVNHAVRFITDAGLEPVLGRLAHEAEPIEMRSDIAGTAAWISDAALGALNGAVGDYLQRSNNPLDLGLSLRFRDRYLDATSGTPELPARLAVYVHGLGTTEWSWCFNAFEAHGDAAQCFGTLLEKDAGLAPLFVRYNSGRRVVENGSLLADALERAFEQRLPQELVLVGHSMGGLVLQSACHQAVERGYGWPSRVSRVFSLGSPHQGAPLEQLGSAAATLLAGIDWPSTRIPGEILRRRSAGMQDLRRGQVLDGDEPARLLPQASYYFVSATITSDPHHPLGWLAGDVLVRVPSASGPARMEPGAHFETSCLGGMVHQELQNHPDVYAVLKRACAGG